MLYFLLTLVIAIIIYYYYYYYNKEEEDNYVKFLTKKETETLIKNDRDYYIELLSDADIKARNEETKEEYKRIAMLDGINIKNKKYIINCCKKADKWFKNKELKYIGKNHNIDKIEWIIGCTKGYYEEGHPHTRGKVIMITNNIDKMEEKDIISLLIHEKVHIYERFNREKVIVKLENEGYKKKENKWKESLRRGNPDIDENIYTNPEGQRMIFLYNSEEPKSITDGYTEGGYEHPFEMISYEIEKDYMKDYNKDE